MSLEVAQQLFVPFQLETRMQAALHENLVAAQGDGFRDLLVEGFARQDISVGVGALAIKGTKVADCRTDIGVVDVAVDVVGSVRVGVQPAANDIRSAPKCRQVSALEKGHAFVERQPAAINGFAQDARDCGIQVSSLVGARPSSAASW